MDAKYAKAVETQKRVFGVNNAQLAKQYARNAKDLRWMEERAKTKGSYNGGTAEYWGQRAAEFEQVAEELCGS